MNEWHVEMSVQPCVQLYRIHHHHHLLICSHCNNNSNHQVHYHYQQLETYIPDPHSRGGIGATKISARGNHSEIIDAGSGWCSWVWGRWSEDRGTRICGGGCLDFLVGPLLALGVQKLHHGHDVLCDGDLFWVESKLIRVKTKKEWWEEQSTMTKDKAVRIVALSSGVAIGSCTLCLRYVDACS